MLLLIESGATIEEMAAELQLGQGTVKTHVRHIYTKLGIHNQIQTATFARRLCKQIGKIMRRRATSVRTAGTSSRTRS